MAVIELNLLNSPNEISQMGEHFQDEHRFAKIFSQMGECAPTVLTTYCVGVTVPSLMNNNVVDFRVMRNLCHRQ